MRRLIDLLRLCFSRRGSAATASKCCPGGRSKRTIARIDPATAPKDRLRDIGLLDGRPGRRGRAGWE
ncbi:hypothetical protein [Notoacmeibacter marinus]|uniref:hypothetical protein n=1 Tax=Notoacmeibacter marinus TaxID=1876515 RepID=UPI00117A797F|nr:hypothetical protein [Notoacmeibacter marinus]